MRTLGPVELLILLVMLALLIVPLWAVVDAARRPDGHWAAAGHNKTHWMLFLTIGSLLPVVGLVLLVVYVASVRPQLQRAG